MATAGSVAGNHEEGLCDAIACQLVPEEARARGALRYFAARFAFGEQELSLASPSRRSAGASALACS